MKEDRQRKSRQRRVLERILMAAGRYEDIPVREIKTISWVWFWNDYW